MLQTKNVIYAISFMDLFAIGLIFPLFGNHLKSLGASHLIIGLIGSTYSGIQIISGPLIGSWSDVEGRKTVLKISLFLCVFCYLFLGFMSSIIAIFLIRIFLGCFKHTQTICRAMISDLFPPEKQAEMLSRSSALGAIGFIAGPFLGGYISELHNGFTYICLFTSTLFVINIVLSSFLPTFKSEHTKGMNQPLRHKTIKEEFLEIGSNVKNVNWKENWHLFAMRFLFGIASSLYFYNQPFYVKDFFNLSQRQTGHMISFCAIIQTGTVFLLDHINRIFYKNNDDCTRRILHSFLLMSISSLLFYLASDIKMYLLCAVPFAISTSVLRISTMELLLAKCDKDRRGTFAGVSNSIMSVARLITPVMSGLVSDTVSSGISIILPSLPALAGIFLTLRTLKMLDNSKKLN